MLIVLQKSLNLDISTLLLFAISCQFIFRFTFLSLGFTGLQVLAYSRIIENAAIDLNLQPHFKNTVTGPGYNRILNVAQNGSIVAFFTKRNYKSQPIGGGKMQLQVDLQLRLKERGYRPHRGLLSHSKSCVCKCGYRKRSYSLQLHFSGLQLRFLQ